MLTEHRDIGTSIDVIWIHYAQLLEFLKSVFWFNTKLFFTSHHDIIKEKPTKLSYIYVYLWALYQIWVSCQSIYIESRTTTFPCLAFQFICRTWESLTFDMFSEDEEVSIRLRLFHKQGCCPLLGAFKICNFRRLESLDELLPKQVTVSHPMNVSNACDMWHVTLSHRDMWQYLTLTWDMWDILWC